MSFIKKPEQKKNKGIWNWYINFPKGTGTPQCPITIRIMPIP
jgi:hypothetical protein